MLSNLDFVSGWFKRGVEILTLIVFEDGTIIPDHSWKKVIPASEQEMGGHEFDWFEVAPKGKSRLLAASFKQNGDFSLKNEGKYCHEQYRNKSN